MTVSLQAELKANYGRFSTVVVNDLAAISAVLLGEEAVLLKSYYQICAFRGFHEVALTNQSEESISFFIEAHNDLLTSHVLAASGMWRSAHIALRSFMESYLGHIYFQDHPIELELWADEKFKTEPRDLRAYSRTHPAIAGYAISKSASDKLDSQYARLSKSVHGSKVDFRMTDASNFPAIASSDVIKLRKWQSLAADVVRTALVLYLSLHADKLKGAAHPVFRKVLGASLTPTMKVGVKAQLGVVLS